jgi:pilus assembly protein CpaB
MLLLVAGLVALGTVFAARTVLRPAATLAPPSVKTTQILAAARDLPTGTTIKEVDMKWIPWPSDADTSRLYLKGKDEMSALVGAILRDGIRTGEPISQGRVVQPRDHGFLAAVLAPGKRAMTVTLTPSSEVAGFIFPGDHVDVILTHSFNRKDVSETERRVSETILSDVRVLALDQKSDNQSNDPKVAALATLEVSPRQAEKLALAADLVGQAGGAGHGSISLALRSLATDSEASTSTAIPPSLSPEALSSPLEESGPTWDSDVSPAYPSVNGGDDLMQHVQVMRGKETAESSFFRHK